MLILSLAHVLLAFVLCDGVHIIGSIVGNIVVVVVVCRVTVNVSCCNIVCVFVCGVVVGVVDVIASDVVVMLVVGGGGCVVVGCAGVGVVVVLCWQRDGLCGCMCYLYCR